MHTHKFSIPQLLQYGFKKAIEHVAFIAQVMVILLVVSFITKGSGILSAIVSVCAAISLTTVMLMIVRGHKPVLMDLFKKYNNYKVFLHYILASLIFGAILGAILSPVLLSAGGLVTGGISAVTFFLSPLTLLLAVLAAVAIYVATRLQFYKYFVIDKGQTALKALSHSWQMTKGHFLHFFLYVVTITIINIIGGALFVVGLLITVPVTALATAKLYDTLTADHHES